MSHPYVELLKTSGGPGFTLAGFFARLPLSMGGIALLLLMEEVSGSWAIAGAVDACWILANALLAPRIARFVDRHGQLNVVGPQITLHVLGVGVLLTLYWTEAPLWTFFIVAGLAGAALPVVGSLVRARWAYLTGSSPLLRTAYAWESVVDEVVFVVGPPLAAFTAAFFGPSTAVGLAATLGALGTVALLAQRRSEPPPLGRRMVKLPSILRVPGMRVVIVVMALLGGVFAGVEVTVIATARSTGQTAWAGVVLALWALSSMVAGLVIGGMRRTIELRRQLLVASSMLGILLLPLIGTDSLVFIGLVLFIAGVAVSPSLIAGFSLVEGLVPPTRLTEALTWAVTGLSVGFALGSPGSGWLVDHIALDAGFWVGILSAGGAVLATLLGYRHLRTSRVKEPAT